MATFVGSETAFKTQYRDEFIAGFEQHESLLRGTVTTESVINGNTATFLVADSGNAEPVTRGVNGMIQARGDNMKQPVATLVEWHDLVRKTRFNIFASQGNQRAIMQKTSMSVVNRKIDQDIISALDGATQFGGVAAATGSKDAATKCKAILQNGEVPWDSNICALVTPSFESYLYNDASFGNRDYGNQLPDQGADLAWKDKPRSYFWLGMEWIVHPRLPGSVGAGGDASVEICYFFHKAAIGHAYNSDNIQALTGYDEEQDYSWARTSIFMGGVLLQNQGVVKFRHVGTAHKATA